MLAYVGASSATSCCDYYFLFVIEEFNSSSGTATADIADVPAVLVLLLLLLLLLLPTGLRLGEKLLNLKTAFSRIGSDKGTEA